MEHEDLPAHEVVRRGEAMYAAGIRDSVEPGRNGKFLVVDIQTGDYEVDSDEAVAFERAMSKNPDGLLYLKRIGYSAAHRIGGPGGRAPLE